MSTNPLIQTQDEENMLETEQQHADLEQSSLVADSGSLDASDASVEPTLDGSDEGEEKATGLTEGESIEKEKAKDRKIIDQVGQLTRSLHDSLRELGYDKRLESISAEVPEAQDKLTYIASKTEQAAERVLNATETAMPIQEKLSSGATDLSAQWKEALESQQSQPDVEKFKSLLIETLTYLNEVPSQADATNSQLMEIMMAQDFQDLTGQVIKTVTTMVQTLEKDLVQLLLANVPTVTTEEGLMNGPVVNPEKRTDVVDGQDQVDDLLASLGF